MIPDLDRRREKMLGDEIDRLARSYTPEWRFNRERPDTGSTLACLFACLMEEMLKEYNQMPQKNRLAFLEILGIGPLKPQAATGYMTLHLTRGDMPGALVKSGTGILADAPDGSLIRYETEEDVFVSPAEVLLHRETEGEWRICFDQNPGAEAVSLLILLEQSQEAGSTRCCWEYQGDMGWKELQTEDRTEQLSHSGMIRFLPPEDWQQQSDGCWLRICVGRELSRVFVNAVSVCACVPGANGNLPAGGSHRLAKTIGYVSEVRNPDALFGGTDEEGQEAAVIRGSARLRHGFRAVTPGDMERLVYEVCPDISRVKCYQGYQRQGIPQIGAVTVVIVTEDYREIRHGFYALQERVASYLKKHTDALVAAEGMLYVTGPLPVRIHVTCGVCVTDNRELLSIRMGIEQQLEQFLNPFLGNRNNQGWELGKLPEYGQIRDCLLSIAGVAYLDRLHIAYEKQGEQGYEEALWEQLQAHPWTLPEAGRIRVGVCMRTDGKEESRWKHGNP